MAAPMLPAIRQRAEILDRIEDNKCTLVIGETGCGKSTQVPKMLTELFPRSRILCTQPRRLAVVAVATRVAEELGCELNGNVVGYSIGQDHEKDRQGETPSLQFVTAGFLLQRLKSEGAAALSRVSCLVIDEVHERSPENDLVLAFVKILLPTHTKLVLMSASPDHHRLRDYFTWPDERMQLVGLAHSASIFNISEKYLSHVRTEIADEAAAAVPRIDMDENVLDEVENLAMLYPIITLLVCKLLRTDLQPGAAILVFLPTWNALEAQAKLLSRARLPGVPIACLHSHVDMEACMETLAAEELGDRKRIILASPIAESSVTINNVAHVIDCCRTCEVYWSRRAGDNLSHIVMCSKSQAKQRRGRTGRTCDGTVWRLVSREAFNSFDDFETSTLCNQSQRKESLLLSCSVERKTQDAASFLQSCLDCPAELRVEEALKKLTQMYMLEQRTTPATRRLVAQTHYSPTPYGRLADSLPIELPSAEFLLHSAVVGLLPEAIVLASLANTTPLPVARRIGDTETYEQLMCKLGAPSIVGGARELLANLGAYELWQRMLRDPQRFRRWTELGLVVLSPGLDANVEADKKAELDQLEAAEDKAWCERQVFARSALWATSRLVEGLVGRLRRRNPPLYHRSIPQKPRRMDLRRGGDGAGLLSRFVSDENEVKLSAMMRLLAPEGDVDKEEAASGEAALPPGAEPVAPPASPNPSGRVRRTACTFFLRGNCNRGSACPFEHARDAERPLCRYISMPGGCRFGSRCIYRHETKESEQSSAALRERAHGELAALKLCASIDDVGVVHAADGPANCAPPVDYATKFCQVLALDDHGLLCQRVDLARMRRLGATLLVATSAARSDDVSQARGRDAVQRDVFGVDPLCLHQLTSPLHAPLTDLASSGRPVDCVLLRCPPTAEVAEAFFRSMLLCVAVLAKLAPTCQVHIVGTPELVVNLRVAECANEAFFCLTGVHAPSDAHVDDDDDSHRLTLTYTFSFDTPRCNQASVVAPLLTLSDADTVRAGWLALHLAEKGLQLEPTTIDLLCRAKAGGGVLAIDTEDAGQAGSVLQIGYVLGCTGKRQLDSGETEDTTDELLAHEALLTLPPNVTAIQAAVFAKHGITIERLQREGVNALDELRKLKLLVDAARVCGVTIAAHNASTHTKQLNDTLLAHETTLTGASIDPVNVTVVEPHAVMCTMRLSAAHCDLHDAQGRLKMPTRQELFQKLFPEEALPEVRNDALTDARMTMKSFVQGEAENVWLWARVHGAASFAAIDVE